MAPLPELIDDAIAEILLRLPPGDPACLVRASLVCKLWRRILSDPTFPHRYREFHRTPPLLFYIKAGLFFPIATRIPLLQPPFKHRALDCRHGRILLDSVGGKNVAVWDPVTGDHRFFRDPDPASFGRSGMVLCAAAGCNHRACSHGGPFVVVLVTSVASPFKGTEAIARVYWSDREPSDSWSAAASLQLPQDSKLYTKRGALVEDQIYFLLTRARILKYDLGKHCLTMICLPCMYNEPCTLMAMEGGLSLGFVTTKDSTIHLWVRKVNPDGSMEWVQDRVILLSDLVPVVAHTYRRGNVIGFAEGVDILLLGKDASGFMFELKSGRFQKLRSSEYHYYNVLPYLSFYIPDFGSHKLPLPVETE